MVQQMKRYDSYKGSDLLFIGEVPNNWKITKIKYLSNCNTQVLTENTDEDFSFHYIDISSVSSDGKISFTEEITFGNAPSRARRVVKENDTIISTVRTYLKAVAFIPKHENNLIASTGFAVITPKDIDPRFLFYVLRNEGFVSEVSANSVGVSYPAITSEQLIRFKIAYPQSSKEQAQIASFLDIKTTEIESLIAYKEKLVALLEQQRQAIITESVTKGINPNVKMKDSGVEWLGEVPEHWKIKKIKHKFIIQKRISAQEDPSVLSLTQKGLKIKDLDDFSGQHAESYSNYQLVNIKDFVMNSMDLLTGFIDCSPYFGVTSPDYRVFSQLNPEECHQYFLYYFQMCYYERIFYGHGQGVSKFGRWRLQTDVFKDFPIMEPPIKEQFEIARSISEKTNAINEIIQMNKEHIEKLREYRQSLIFEVVTGKIDVRDVEMDVPVTV